MNAYATFLTFNPSPVSSRYDDTISFSQPVNTNLTNAILFFVLFLVYV